MRTRFQIYLVAIIASMGYNIYRQDYDGAILAAMVLPIAIYSVIKYKDEDEK